jgi:uncharacterized membrane protein YedE/YeeE
MIGAIRKRTLWTFAAGAMFGVGLVVSGMTDPRNVVGFLDFGGAFNPRLLAVMAGAVAVHAALLRLVASPGKPFRTREPRIDRPLVLGSAIFGVGWGLSGYCPGPAITAAGLGAGAALGFLAAMIVGALAADRFVKSTSSCG